MQSLKRLPMLIRSSKGATRLLTTTACTCANSPTSSANSDSTSSTTAAATTSTPSQQPRRSDLSSATLRYLHNISPKDLANFDPILDIHPDHKFSPARSKSQKHDTHITLLSSDSYQQPKPAPEMIEGLPGEDDSTNHLAQITQLTPGEIRSLYRFPLITKRVVSMKSKGKMPSMYSLVVVGNGKGLVGVGEGKDETANKAVGKAFNQAVRSMDYVERYQDRTVWGTLDSNFGSCSIQMRSRPPGFGLRVNHFIHQVAKAAGISDLSAKVYGSRNGTRVIKLAVAMLHGGSTPVDMGGFGKEKGQRRNKKTTGLATAEEIGRARGRRAVAI